MRVPYSTKTKLVTCHQLSKGEIFFISVLDFLLFLMAFYWNKYLKFIRLDFFSKMNLCKFLFGLLVFSTVEMVVGSQNLAQASVVASGHLQDSDPMTSRDLCEIRLTLGLVTSESPTQIKGIPQRLYEDVDCKGNRKLGLPMTDESITHMTQWTQSLTEKVLVPRGTRFLRRLKRLSMEELAQDSSGYLLNSTLPAHPAQVEGVLEEKAALPDMARQGEVDFSQRPKGYQEMSFGTTE